MFGEFEKQVTNWKVVFNLLVVNDWCHYWCRDKFLNSFNTYILSKPLFYLHIFMTYYIFSHILRFDLRTFMTVLV